ncbi:MAG TPA: DUF2059 domain-containing protein [Longimicrobium sp.]|nr:DUF2059 domain-containing protein [Longimicrobium sp.]
MKKVIAAAFCAAALAVAAPARAQEPTPARLALAEQLMTAADMERNYRRTMDVMIQQQMRQNPMLQQFEATMRSFFDKYLSWNEVRGDMVRVYALTYTEDELRQLATFYRTPLGQRLLETAPELAARSAELTQRRLMEHMPELQQQIMQQMQGAGSTAPTTP